MPLRGIRPCGSVYALRARTVGPRWGRSDSNRLATHIDAQYLAYQAMRFYTRDENNMQNLRNSTELSKVHHWQYTKEHKAENALCFCLEEFYKKLGQAKRVRPKANFARVPCGQGGATALSLCQAVHRDAGALTAIALRSLLALNSCKPASYPVSYTHLTLPTSDLV